jgi:hypothetical protein
MTIRSIRSMRPAAAQASHTLRGSLGGRGIILADPGVSRT